MAEPVNEGRVWGRRPVLEMLRAGARRVEEIAVLAGATGSLAEVVAVARRAGVKVSFRTRDQLTAIAGCPQHQGVVARVASSEYADLDDILEVPASRGEPAFLLALDRLQDPQNFGAVLRVAAGFGVHGVLVPRHHAVGLTGAAVKVAMGAAEHVRVAREPNLVSSIERIKKSGIWVYGGTVVGGLPPWKVTLTGPVCLVLGSEAEGLRSLVARSCDQLLTIPMSGPLGSLNVSAASAALCYEVCRQRSARPLDFKGS